MTAANANNNGNGGLRNVFTALFMAASLVGVGWVLDGRIETKMETLRVEQRDQGRQLTAVGETTARIDERLKSVENTVSILERRTGK